MMGIDIYETDSGAIEVRMAQDSVWLTQAQMVLLFGRDQSVVSRHIGNIFREGELERESSMQKMHSAHSDKPVEVYNLDGIILVGYPDLTGGTHQAVVSAGRAGASRQTALPVRPGAYPASTTQCLASSGWKREAAGRQDRRPSRTGVRVR